MDDHILLLQPEVSRTPWWKKSKYMCPLLFMIGVCCLAAVVAICIYKNAYEGPIALSIMSLNCWGTPGSMGAVDKELRMKEIGKMIQKKEHDLYLLEELWMRPDHATIQGYVNSTGYQMTEVGDLAVPNWCDGRVDPMYCSGLAIVSKYPILEKDFQVFSVHGDAFWNDGEYFARKGVGRVRIEPQPNITVDVFVTHTAASDYNYYYREIQTREIVEHVKSSKADFTILGGDFNIDPRMTNETTYETLTTELRGAMQEFFGYLSEMLKPNRATYGNPDNNYSNFFGPQLYDYIFHRSKGWNSVIINIFDVPILKAFINRDPSSSEKESSNVDVIKEMSARYNKTAADFNASISAENKHSLSKRGADESISLSDHEAITSSVLLFKYRWNKNN